ncbi:MAG: DUF4136 domain-containing protein [Bacteroidota bacterium]|nr:DUF4136 domain-containing protein [Bacteroidota bacterium]
MKRYFFFFVLTLFSFASCNSVRVAADYDRSVTFETYQSFAFFKEGIDKAEISDLDKRRILRAIESEMLAKGFLKSETPDLLINIFTKERQEVNVYNQNFGMNGWGWGWGWGWGPMMGWNQTNVSNSSRGTLYIDLIDAQKNELVWQGIGEGYLSSRMEKKEERILEFVTAIMGKYPPEKN